MLLLPTAQVTGRTALELGTLHDTLAAMPVSKGERGSPICDLPTSLTPRACGSNDNGDLRSSSFEGEQSIWVCVRRVIVSVLCTCAGCCAWADVT
jgi:hypothetical protein